MAVECREFAYHFEIRDFADEPDGRTVYGRIVPYGETIEFVDRYDHDSIKRERFRHGALERQTRGTAWGRVALAFEHTDGFSNTIGYGRKIEERADGAYATFRLYQADALKATEMIRESHKGLSLEFEPIQSSMDGPVIVRNQVNVRRVGVVPDPAYLGAQVLALRQNSMPAEPATTPHLDAVRESLAQLRRDAP